MNKLITKISALALGLGLAVGVGVGAGQSKKTNSAKAADGDITVSLDFSTNTYGISSTQGDQTLTGDGATYGFEFKKGTGTGAKSNTGYILFGKAGVYFHNTSAPSNSYISAISWSYSSGVSTNVQLSLSYGTSVLTAESSPITSFGKATKSGTVSLNPTDTTMRFFFLYVTNAYNCQLTAFSVTWSSNGGESCDHDWVAGTVHAPTCTENGYTEYECSLCHEEKQDDVVAALGHDYGDWTEVTAPTCTEAGEERRVCSHDASHVETRPIAALGHSYVNHICERCGEEEPDEIIVSTSISEYASTHSWENAVQYSSMQLGSDVSLTASGSANTGKYYSKDGGSWRFYASENGALIITVNDPYSLVSATLTFSGENSPAVQFEGNNVTSGTAVALYNQSATFNATGGKVYITAISVTYSSGSEPVETFTITYLGNAEDVEGSMSPTTAASPQVASCEFTRTGYEFARWNTQADGEGDNYEVGTSVTEDLTLYAIWQEYIPPIEGNVTMTGVTSASSVTVNGHQALKCGAGSTAGVMTLTLTKANITKIKVYVAGWSSDTNRTINVSIDNGSISESSITITGDSAISGTATTFTLNSPETTYKFEFTITDAPANTVITLTAANAKNNRFVVWGATDLFAETFADEFNSNVSCNVAGTSEPVITGDWSSFQALYNGLDAEEKAKLHDATFTVTGSGSSTVVTATGTTSQSVAEAMARYDYIVGKYNKGMHIATYNDFINRNPVEIGAGLAQISTGTNNNIDMIIVIAAFGASTLFFVTLCIVRKRKRLSK